ncbi:unnamed protein product [Didymodactylos carnosus]|uniref:NHL repeat containing protein n=1 Tax=Didymodactylos carnosus TaxID=1234261 RepID=A0A815CUV2_9BILA|nr:unnamed protein product [Didymodactylos carnosus]CAF4084231.1 unnamed protein product [Didymodactylos carnosus]
MLVTIPQPTLSNTETTATAMSSRSDKLGNSSLRTLCSATAVWNQTAVTIAGNGSRGGSVKQLCNPFDVFVDSNGSILIADTTNMRVIQWDPNAVSGVVVVGDLGPGNLSNQLYYPTSVFIYNDSLYVLDYFNFRVQKYQLNESSYPLNGTTIVGLFGHGSNNNQISNSFALFVDSAGNLYISDGYNHRVMLWTQGATTGVVVAGGHGYGNMTSQLFYPYGIYVDETSSIFVSDCGNDRVMKWLKGSNTGIIVAGLNGSGSGNAQLLCPLSVILDENGYMYIADSNNYRIQQQLPGAQEGRTIIGGSFGLGSNQLSYVEAIKFDSDWNLIVADTANHRIQKFNLISNGCD